MQIIAGKSDYHASQLGGSEIISVSADRLTSAGRGGEVGFDQ